MISWLLLPFSASKGQKYATLPGVHNMCSAICEKEPGDSGSPGESSKTVQWCSWTPNPGVVWQLGHNFWAKKLLQDINFGSLLSGIIGLSVWWPEWIKTVNKYKNADMLYGTWDGQLFWSQADLSLKLTTTYSWTDVTYMSTNILVSSSEKCNINIYALLGWF